MNTPKSMSALGIATSFIFTIMSGLPGSSYFGVEIFPARRSTRYLFMCTVLIYFGFLPVAFMHNYLISWFSSRISLIACNKGSLIWSCLIYCINMVLVDKVIFKGLFKELLWGAWEKALKISFSSWDPSLKDLLNIDHPLLEVTREF